MADDARLPREINTNVAHSARVYDYWLGGKDNFAADRELAEKLIAVMPGTPASARANRDFLKRAVRFVAEQGVRQFIDIGSGLPTAENTHEIAQRVARDARVVYVDKDPIVLAHGRALLAAEGSTTVIQEEVQRPDAVLNHAEARRYVDFDQPLCVLMLGILHFVADDDEANQIVAGLRDAMVPGSFLIVSHLTADSDPEGIQRFMEAVRQSPSADASVVRSRDQVAKFFDGFEILDPGIVAVDQWRPEGGSVMDPFWLWGGVGRKS